MSESEVVTDRTLGIAALACELTSPSSPPAESWRPWIVRVEPGEACELEDLCRAHRVALIDEIGRQLADLAVVRLPAAEPVSRAGFIEEMVSAHGGRESCGVWVYVPWDGKIVHVLDRDDYFDVITDRNRDKITREEQRLLRTKRIGVMGLSVGGEAAVTLAQEHLCGTVVLADFDRLDLSNLNRLNAGCDDLGVNKAVLVARRIARIDPFLEVIVYDEGVTAANAAQFLDGLDLLVEECDGLGMKYEIRKLAKERALNVVFAADERGFLSVEPHAHVPDLPPFHGRIGGRQPDCSVYSSALEYMRALTEWMGGWDNISERSRRSLEQIGNVVSGYPQLAGEARYAAGQLSHVARRLLLGERLPPLVGHFDPEELLESVPGS